MSATTAEALRSFIDDIQGGEATRPGTDGWPGILRREAAARFRTLGYPTTRQEAWRYLNLRPLKQHAFRSAGIGTPSGLEVDRLTLAEVEGPRAVFFNGAWMAPPVDGPGASTVEIRSLREVLLEDRGRLEGRLGSVADDVEHPFTALNTALIDDGAYIRIGAGVAAGYIHLVFIGGAPDGPAAGHPRVFIDAEAGASATVVEEYVSLNDGVAMSDAVTEVLLAENARVEHVRLQREGSAVFHFGTVAARLQRDARFDARSLVLGSGLSRIDVRVALLGEGAACDLSGLYAVAGNQVVDHHTYIDHAVPHTTSNQMYKGVLDDKARAVFNGLIEIRPGAQQTVAEQHNQNLLLSEKALVHTNPQLKIFADDVRCKHGATVGQLDGEKLFYLRARGIPEPEARQILVGAFATEVVDTISVEPVRDALASAVAKRFMSDV